MNILLTNANKKYKRVYVTKTIKMTKRSINLRKRKVKRLLK